MSEEQISLDQWISNTAGAFTGKDRQQYIYFQKDWTDGHMNNPLLFPFHETPDFWREQFNWFLEVENHAVDPNKKIKKASPESPAPVAKSAEPRQSPPKPPPGRTYSDKKTVILENKHDQPAFDETRFAGALDDDEESLMDTLDDFEAQADLTEQKAEIPKPDEEKTPPKPRTSPPLKKALDKAQTTKKDAGSKKTVSKPAEPKKKEASKEDMELDFDDLDGMDWEEK